MMSLDEIALLIIKCLFHVDFLALSKKGKGLNYVVCAVTLKALKWYISTEK